jgi:hypothetical protein
MSSDDDRSEQPQQQTYSHNPPDYRKQRRPHNFNRRAEAMARVLRVWREEAENLGLSDIRELAEDLCVAIHNHGKDIAKGWNTALHKAQERDLKQGRRN